jgi:hypothetical protein
MKSTRSLSLAALAFLVAILSSSGALAQTRATLNGTVTEQSDAVVSEVDVTIRNVATGWTSKVKTDSSGYYTLPNIPPGVYEIKAERSGFATYAQTGIELHVADTLTLDVKLSVGNVTETVMITQETPLVETSRVEVSQVIEGRRIADLPINGRNFVDFALLTPTVVVGQGLSGGGQSGLFEQVPKISFHGLGENATNFFALDGADFNVTQSGFQHSGPSQEAVAEFRVVQNTYKAEYGRFLAGYINIITKSGTNDHHGSAYYYGRNDALDAKSILTFPGFHVLKRHQFGATLGGPIKKDKTFFFGSYEAQRQKRTPNFSTFFLQNIASINRVKAFYHLAPEDTSVLEEINYNTVLGRIDHQLTEKHQLVGRYLYFNQSGKNVTGSPFGIGTPSSLRENPVKDQSLVGKLISTLSDHVFNEFLVQFSRRENIYHSTNGEPNLAIASILSTGRSLGGTEYYAENRWQFSDNLSYLRGAHSLKFGGDYNHVGVNAIKNFGVNGYFQFTVPSFLGQAPFNGTLPGTAPGVPTPVIAFLAMPRNLIGTPFVRSTDWTSLYPFPGGEDLFRHKYKIPTFNFYGQDEWRASKRLTFNLGVHYFYESAPPEMDLNKDTNNFDPRVGFAYSFWNNRAVLRGGSGIYHARRYWGGPLSGNMFAGAATPAEFGLVRPGTSDVFRRTQTSIVSIIAPLPTPAVNNPAAIDYMQNGRYPTGAVGFVVLSANVRDWPNPYSIKWGLEQQLEVNKDLSVTFGYLGVHSMGQELKVPYNVRPVGTTVNGRTQYGFINPNYFLFLAEIPGSDAIYHGGTLAIEKRFSHNFALNANYTYSKSIDISAGTGSLSDACIDALNCRMTNRALSNEHIGQRLVVSFLAQAPKDSFLRHFKLGAIATLQTPRYYTVYAGSDVNRDGNSGSDPVGQLGRNTYKGDNYQSIDLRVSREIFFTERVKGEIIAEAFNLFNRVNVTVLNTVYGAPNFIGPIPRQYKDGTPSPLRTFGSPSDVAPPRQIQLGFRLIW